MAVEKEDDVQLEFKSWDDAWYDVSLAIKGTDLLVHYLEFSAEEDERFTVENFQSVEDFRARFRFSSQQLQDENCGSIKKGTNVCASYSGDGEDNRFYNAVVKRVSRSKHHQKGGEEVCRCAFEVLWKDGPSVNKITSVTCENICLLTSGSIEVHPIIKAFVKLVEEKDEQSTHKNTNKKTANVKGNNATHYKGKQGEHVKIASNFVSIDGLEGSCIISGQERLENLSDSFKQNVGPRNTIEADFSGINEVAASSPHMPPMQSQSCKMEELTSDRLNAVDNDVIDCEAKNREKVLKTTVEAPLRTIIQSANEAPHSEAILIEQEETHLDSLRKERKEEKVSLDLNSKIEMEQDLLDIPSQSEAYLMEQEETCVNLVRKEQKLSLDLNSLEQEQLDVPTTRVGFHSNTNNANGKDNGFSGISKNVGSLKSQGSFRSGWLEAEDCGTLQIGKGGFNAINKETVENSAGMKRPPTYDFENIDEQVIVEENRNDEEIREKKKVLASSWGKGKRQKHISNELFTGDRKVQDHNQTSENVNTSKKIQDGNDFNGVDSLSSSYLTPHLENSTSHVTTETVILSADMDKADAVKCVINHVKLHKQEESLPGFLSVGEINHDTLRKKCDNEILDLNKQPDNYVQLQEDLSTSEEIKEGCKNRVKFEGQKNLPPNGKDHNSHYASEKSNYCSCDYCEQDLDRCQSQLTSKECESHSAECRCYDLHSCNVYTSSEDESFDVEVTSCNCCGNYLKPIVLCNRTSTRIHEDPQEAICGCNGAGLGHCSEDIGAEDRIFNHSEVLVLDNLEKDVRPSDVKRVMACVTCAVQVYIFPSLKFEQFTRGFVWFQDHSSLMKALALLQNDDFFIISSKGRPWVALLLHIDNEVCKGIFGGYDIEPEDCQHCCLKTFPSKILRVNRGTDEYERAKKRKNMFLEFKEHLAILHKRLELEECSL